MNRTPPIGRLVGARRRDNEALIERVERLQDAVDRVQGTVDDLHPAVKKLGEQQVRHVLVDYQPAKIVLETSNRRERKRRWATDKEPWTVAWIDQLRAGSVLWDIGANVGAYSLIAAMRPQGRLKVVSVEPSFSSFASLCRNIILNEAGDHITALPVMLGSATSMQTLGYADVSAGAASHAGGAAALIEGFEPAFEQPMLTFALDDLIAQFDLPAPDYVKLDVDGAETLVLTGAKRTLNRIDGMLLEVSDRERDVVDRLVEQAGLRPRPEAGQQGGLRRDGTQKKLDYVIYDRVDSAGGS